MRLDRHTGHCDRFTPALPDDVPPPAEVRDLQDVRAAIDSIDAQIVELLGLRLDYVLAAAQFKPDLASIPAPDRVREMLDQRGEWARGHCQVVVS